MGSRDSLYACLGSTLSGLLIAFVLHNPNSLPNIYSDIIAFWQRGWVFSGQFPYVTESFEYPPISGIILYFSRILGGSEIGYYLVFSGFSMIAGVVVAVGTWLLGRALGKDVKSSFFLLPSMMIYGIYNFDLFHTAFVIVSLWALVSGKRTWAAVTLGLAISTKLASGVLLPVYLLEIRNRRNALEFLGTLLGVVGAINLPLIFANFSAWYGTYTFIGNWGLEDAWFGWIFQDPSSWFYAKIFGFALMGVLLLRVYTLRVDVTTKTFLALVAYLLGTYIYSPQFNLLLVPLVAILAIDHPSTYIWDACNVLIILTWFISPGNTLSWSLPQEFALVRAPMLLWMALYVLRKGGWNLRSLLPHLRQKTLEEPVKVPGLSGTLTGE